MEKRRVQAVDSSGQLISVEVSAARYAEIEAGIRP